MPEELITNSDFMTTSTDPALQALAAAALKDSAPPVIKAEEPIKPEKQEQV